MGFLKELPMSNLDFELSDFLKCHWWKIVFIPLLVFKLLELQFKARVFTILFKFWLAAFVLSPLAWGFGAWCLYCVWAHNGYTLKNRSDVIIGVSILFFLPSVALIIWYTFFRA
jgi:hypothetical protein